MLYILFSLVLIFPVLMGFGQLFQRIFGQIFEGISAKLLSGMVFLILIWHILAFFIPLNIGVEGVSVGVGLILFFYFKAYQEWLKIPKKTLFLWIIFVLVSALLGSGFPFILDHFGYYVPSIKWLSEVGLPKGITNVGWVLGQMSPWHIFQAGFSHFSDPFLRINMVLISIFFLYILERKSWVMLCFLPILFFFLQSPSPDLPSIIFSLIILNEILRKNQQFSLLFAFSVWVFSIKPTMIWLPILAFFYPILIFRKNLKFSILGVVIGLIYIVKNLWVFGYPFFPVGVLDFDVSWKPCPDMFLISSEVAVLKTFDMQYSLEEIARFSWWEYAVNWLFLSGIKGVIHCLFVLSLILFAIFVIIKKERILTLIFVSVLLKSILVLGFSAQYRFFIDVFFAIFLVVLGQFFTKRWSVFSFSLGSFLVMILLFFPNILAEKLPSFRLGQYMKGFRWGQLYRPSHYVFNQYNTYQLGNLTFNVPKNYVFDFDVKLPVLALENLEDFYALNIFPQMIGNDLKQGFVWRKLTSEEKQKLEQIIEKIKREE